MNKLHKLNDNNSIFQVDLVKIKLEEHVPAIN